MLKELLPKSRLYKVVCTDDRNEDQDLFGFYPNARMAAQAISALEKRCSDWNKRCNGQLVVAATLLERANDVCVTALDRIDDLRNTYGLLQCHCLQSVLNVANSTIDKVKILSEHCRKRLDCRA